MQNSLPKYDRPVLTGILEEFRNALDSEIRAVKIKTSGSAVPLNNGRKTGYCGGEFQYRFSADTSINAPADSPATLVVETEKSYDVSIISSEESYVFLSSRHDIGEFIGYARLESDLSILMKRLIERIEANSAQPNPGGNRMLGRINSMGNPAPDLKTGNGVLNENQINAVKSALGRNLTYIWGPPGTGKTTVIGKIIEELFHSCRTVLLVSHTNTAVDGAIKKVCTSLNREDIEDCSVLRLGLPKDDELINKYPQALLQYHKEIMSKELLEMLMELKKLEDDTQSEIQKQADQISDYKWLLNYEKTRKKTYEDIEKYQSLLPILEATTENIKSYEVKLSQLEDTLSSCGEYSSCVSDVEKATVERQDLYKKLDNIEARLENNRLGMIACNDAILNHHRYGQLLVEKSQYLSETSQKAILKNLGLEIQELTQGIDISALELRKSSEALKISLNNGAIMRALKGLESPEKIKSRVQDLDNSMRQQKEILSAKQAVEAQHIQRYSKLLQIVEEIKTINLISTPGELDENKTQLSIDSQQLIAENHDIQCKVDNISKGILTQMTKIEEIKKQLNFVPEEILSESYSIKASIDHDNIILKGLKRQHKQLEDRLDSFFKANNTGNFVEDYKLALSLLDKKLDSLKPHYLDFSIENINSLIKALQDSLGGTKCKIEEINKELVEVASKIVANAKIIGATLTKAYLSDELQKRKFDTIILDEASMAAIPALWVTAYMAESNIVIVGDFKQLPPIVLSKEDTAIKWIGLDIFEHSGVKSLWEKGEVPENFVILNEQFRMEKEIAEIANRYYEGILKSPSSPKEKDKFFAWYNDIGQSNPITIVDTKNLHAWVTSVVRGGTASRLNYLSASLCVALSKHLTKNLIDIDERNEIKVLIVSPYRPHTKRIELLLKEENVDTLIRAGTIHSFQGSEADIVIFDLVVDEPHWKVNLFMNTDEINEQMKRLFNVAVTRARFKLFVVGNIDYCLKKSKGAELNVFLEYLLASKSNQIIDAKKLFPNLLNNVVPEVIGGAVEMKHERLCVNQEKFYDYLHTDFRLAHDRIVIFSAFLSCDRIAKLLPHLQGALYRSVRVFIVTKPMSERNRQTHSSYINCEKILNDNGISIIHKKGMHEKLVFVDNDIVWTGSLNTLSQSSSEEIMERRKNADVFSDYAKQIRLDSLISAVGTDQMNCPICNSEMIASEGNDNPFFWRCVNEQCYTRSIDQRHPVDGEIRCKRCDGSVEFSKKNEPRWICTVDHKHYQKVIPAHLRLPKMVKKIPIKDLKTLKSKWGIYESKKSKNADNQLSLI